MGGLFDGLDTEPRSHLAIRNWMAFSLDVLPAREDAWDRDAIVRGFWGYQDFES